MKNIVFLLLNIYSINVYCQSPKTETLTCPDCPVGINTPTVKPGIIAEIDNDPNNLGGVLFPEVQLKSLNDITPFKTQPIDGLIVYNPKAVNGLKSGYYFWDSTSSSWSSFEVNDVFEGSNQSTSIDYTAENTWMDLFANVSINQNSSLYSKIDAEHLKINQAGVYRIILNLSITIGNAREDQDILGVALFLDGVQQTERLIVKTKEYAGGLQGVGDEAILYLNIPRGGQVLSVRGFKINEVCQVYGDCPIYFAHKPGASTINIEKLK